MPYNRSAQQRYAARQTDRRDLVRVTVWVPAEARERVIELAENLRKLRKPGADEPTD